MKKVLLASSALMLTAGIAAADVTISGNARFGIEYFDPDIEDVDSETRLDTRLRFNIDASKETDAGVKLGGRIRLQYDDGGGYSQPGISIVDADEDGVIDADEVSIEDGRSGGAQLSAAYVYAEAQGFRVEVGNSNSAYDSAGLMYASEVGTGYYGSSFGNPIGAYFGFSTGPYGTLQNDRMGVYTQYEAGDLVARLSWITPDQGDVLTDFDEITEELSLSFDYATGAFAFSIAYASNGAGIDGNDLFFIGGQYTFNDTYNVGLLWNDNGEIGDLSVGQTITLYGNGTFGATTVQGYLTGISGIDVADEEVADDDMAIGLGANYDLGGASLGGSIESGFDGAVGAKLGVSFSF